MRYPAISPDGKTIAFTFKGDIYKVSIGRRHRDAAHDAHGERLHARLEPRRQADRLRVGPLRQLRHLRHQRRRRRGEAPHLPLGERVSRTSFTADDKSIIFGAARQDAAVESPVPHRRAARAVRSARRRRTPDADSHDARREREAEQRTASFLIYEDKKGQENQWRKHHTSAVARDIWIYDRKAGTHRQLTTFAGEDRNPVFADDDKAFYYLSEESGTLQRPQDERRRRASRSSSRRSRACRSASSAWRTPARSPSDSTARSTRCRAGGRPQKVDIAVSADNKANNERILAVNNGAQGLVVVADRARKSRSRIAATCS